jgi:FdhE protein
MTAIDTGLQDLKRQHPEWEPWLAVVQEILRETNNPQWEAVVPQGATQQDKTPLLAGASLALEHNSVRRLLQLLIQAACRSGTPAMASLEPALHVELDVLGLFQAALDQDGDFLKKTAAGVGAEPEAFQAVAALIPVPFLQACNRKLTPAESWLEGYCPVCGTWPALTEVRGIERQRYFRCGRCGGEWLAHCLFCAFCGMNDHEQLVSLVPEKSGAGRTIEACKRCLGYVKTFTTLEGSAPAKVILDDLASVDLDVAACAEGYKRPQGAGYVLDVTITGNGANPFSVARRR